MVFTEASKFINIDARIVEVHVQLDNLSSQKAAKFTDLQVRTVFLL